jgi:type IV pilus assembly protein PilN
MIRINLLPHREEKRKLKKKAFAAMLLFSAVIGALIILLVGGVFSARLSAQEQRNTYIRNENARLDKQI